MSSVNFTYLLVDAFCLLFPLAFSFHPVFNFVKHWRAFLPALLIVGSIFVIWDSMFTRLGVWSFNPARTLPIRFMYLPLEELFFFVCIPYSSLFLYYCVKKYLTIPVSQKFIRVFIPALTAGLWMVAILNYDKLYTSVTFSLLGFVLLFMLVKKFRFLNSFFVSYLLVLPFFFLSNGVLTGSFISGPVVMYNTQHHMGVRLFTIPLEDVFYGLLLLILNTGTYEYFLSKQNRVPG